MFHFTLERASQADSHPIGGIRASSRGSLLSHVRTCYLPARKNRVLAATLHARAYFLALQIFISAVSGFTAYSFDIYLMLDRKGQIRGEAALAGGLSFVGHAFAGSS